MLTYSQHSPNIISFYHLHPMRFKSITLLSPHEYYDTQNQRAYPYEAMRRVAKCVFIYNNGNNSHSSARTCTDPIRYKYKPLKFSTQPLTPVRQGQVNYLISSMRKKNMTQTCVWNNKFAFNVVVVFAGNTQSLAYIYIRMHQPAIIPHTHTETRVYTYMNGGQEKQF